MNYPLFIFFSLTPSIIWLLFFLRKDVHPEAKGMILKIFFYGMVAAIPAALMEIGFAGLLDAWGIPSFLRQIIYIFLGIALIEEILKFLVVKKNVFCCSEFDEPVDVILYMIIAALGFAALENFLILFPLSNPLHFFETFMVSTFRFVGATFLHALCSGVIGYFLALSFFEAKNKFGLASMGIIMAVLLHGLYDFSIMKIESNLKFVIPIIILVGLAIFVSWGFKKVKKLKSVCLLPKN
jgi:RsiW-degrading membrane proteinase PrsW (M82 family)